MDIAGKHVIVTGGASGIGAALARQCVIAGARVGIADRDLAAAQHLAADIGGAAYQCDVSDEAQIIEVIKSAQQTQGPIDIFVSNAGLGRGDPDHAASSPDAVWELQWKVHVMAHVWAARALLPEMIARGQGYFVNVASAAGLLNQIGDAPYSASKHAAVSFAESLAISHGDDGIGVSVVCPQYVATPLLGLQDGDAVGNLLSADEVAETVLAGVRKGQFMILPHPDVHGFAALRAQDPERWLAGMRKLRAAAIKSFGRVQVEDFYKLV
ncbi:MAG: SDR family NAD(P)-dependent oxidoreductase [Sulfitobacter sp.]